jgi:uncharacterized protein YaiE (UPF0345 family)
MASFKHTFTSGQTVTPARLNDARDVFDIVNGDIKSDAAIAGTKIAPAFGANNITVSSADRSITNTTNHALSFGTNNTERLRITNGGNIGVGTNTPNARLQVAGGVVRIEGSEGEGGHLELLNVANSATQAVFDVSSEDVTRLLVLPAGNLTFGTNSVERMRIDSSGNIGIGISPTDRMNVSDGTANIQLSPLSTIGYIGLRSNHALGLTTNNTERMLINASGNVGIGTSSPNTKLQVAGTVRAEGAGGEGGQFEVVNAANSAVQAIFDVDSSDVTRLLTLPAGPLTFGTNSVERMRIDSTGNVGIGNNNPSKKLSVTGDINTTEQYFVDGTQVVSNRVTGWGAPTGTVSRSALTLTASATYSQSEINTIIQALKAVVIDLRAHGLIGN